MNIYLGTSGSEQLLTELNRNFGTKNVEIKEIIETEDGSLYDYIVSKKKEFVFKFDKILDNNLSVILVEFNKQTILNLKVENSPDSGVYNEYSVIFVVEPDYQLWKELVIEGTKHFIYENCNFSLKEI